MKTLTISALLATLVAIPFVWKRRPANLVPVKGQGGPVQEDLRYDIDDLLT